MSKLGRARARAADTKRDLLDVSWTIPRALYRLSRRRLGGSDQLYRAGIVRQRLMRLPGMTSPAELAYFKWHAQERFVGKGQAVDLGSWFGSTTAALAMGLTANPRPSARAAKVHAYDRFIWEWWMDEYADFARLGTYAPGSSFLREFELVVAPWRDRIEVHAGDLLKQAWAGGGIELLLIDAMKSWELTDAILTRFFGHLLPGQAYVLHQDFGHCYTPWIHLVTYALRDYLAPVQDIDRSDTVVFRCVRSLDGEPAALRLSRASFDDADIEQAFEHSLRITRPEKHSGILAARAILLVQDGDLAAANDLLGRLTSRQRLNEFDATAVRGAIADAQGASV